MCADRERVAKAEQVCERVVCELSPGDCLFFHCNLLHCSAPNTAQDDPRWVRLRFTTHGGVFGILPLSLCCIAIVD